MVNATSVWSWPASDENVVIRAGSGAPSPYVAPIETSSDLRCAKSLENVYDSEVNLIGYVRVSTERQQDGYGPDSQIADIRKWAKANGHKVIAIYQDAISGKTDAIDRPGLSDALDQLRPPPRATGLVVARLDRLARSFTVQEAILAVIWQAGATAFSVDAGEVPQDDPDDPMRTAIRQIMGVIHQLDRALIVKRMRAGRTAKAAQGKHATGPYRYGYRGEGNGRDRDAAPRSDEQDTVERILALRRDGESYRSIAATLDTEDRKPRRGDHWQPTSVRNIIEREQARL